MICSVNVNNVPSQFISLQHLVLSKFIVGILRQIYNYDASQTPVVSFVFGLKTCKNLWRRVSKKMLQTGLSYWNLNKLVWLQLENFCSYDKATIVNRIRIGVYKSLYLL